LKRLRGISTRLIATAVGCVCIFGFAAAALSSEAAADPTEKPVVQESPAVTGTPEPGHTLTCTKGIWLQEPTGYTFEWIRDGAAIESETTFEYEVVETDRGHVIACAVTATNSFGSTTAQAIAVGVPSGRPVVVTPPKISGEPEVGAVLGCDRGVWSGEPTEYAFEWLRDGVAIESETTSEYEVVAADRGHRITCMVTATNSFGPTTAGGGTLEIPKIQHTLTVVVSGASGIVTSEPGGIFCGVVCSLAFDEGTRVTLVAQPDPGTTFAGWTGGCSGTGPCSILVEADATVGASFAAVPSGVPAPPPAIGGSSGTLTTPVHRRRPLRCRKGFRKKKVHGKKRCVKIHRHKPHKKRRHKRKRH
jgi:hypothetical protein